MNKMAVFVEGYTEVVLVDKLIRAIAGKLAIDIRWHRYHGGTSCPQTCRQIQAAGLVQGHDHFIMIYDCRGDEAVKTRMAKEYDNLARAGYNKIVCLRDVYPLIKRKDIPELERNLPAYIKTKPIQVDFILGIMEIESWFLAEHTHFEKIHPSITVEEIRNKLLFDPENGDMQLRDTPADDMNNCYMLAGLPYDKGSGSGTVDQLECDQMYCWPAERIPYFTKLCEIIEAFLKS